MSRLMSVFFMSLLLFVASISADELPVFKLHEGSNTVALSINNKWNNDLSGLTVTIDNSTLPGWLSFNGAPQTVDVRSNTKGRDKLLVLFTVTDAPISVEADIPLMLKDALGNQWKYSATVRVTSGEPLAYALYENYPNPFNPTTTIRYSLKNAHHTKLTVFNTLGQKIRTLVDETKTTGLHTVQWDGRNNMGEQVSSGLYFYRIEAGSFVQTKRMMMLE